MRKYAVDYEFRGFYSIEVEALSEEHAKEEADVIYDHGDAMDELNTDVIITCLEPDDWREKNK